MKLFKPTNILIGIAFALLFLSLAVVITINFRPLYYRDIGALHIVKSSGYPEEEIRMNYNALIDYSSPFFLGKLSFPTLTASKHGLEHFSEVKRIFTFFYILSAITLLSVVAIILHKRRTNDFGYLLVSSVVSFVLPLLVAIQLCLNFDNTFILFHKLVFHNNYWLFDPVTDPVISILPDTFFLHCALLIVFITVFFSMACLGMYFWKKKHFHLKYRNIKA
jgi:integral membrane protein (TIGR01906 family)